MRMLSRPEPTSAGGPSADGTGLATPETTSEGYSMTEGDEGESHSSDRFGGALESCRSHEAHDAPLRETGKGPEEGEPEHQEWSLPVRFIIK